MRITHHLVIASLLLLPFAGSLRAENLSDLSQVLKTRQKENKLKYSSQNIYKVTMRSGVVYRLQTALGYVSTIDLPQKALKVFVGDQDLFKVGVYETQVLIKPLTDEVDARSNLVIVTESSRLTFDISVGAPETADFVMDFRLPQDDEALVMNAFDKKVEEKDKQLEQKYQQKEEKLDEKAKAIAEEKIKLQVAEIVQNVPLKESASMEGVQVNLLSLSQIGDKAYLKFSVLNYSKTPYRVDRVLIGGVLNSKNPLKKTVANISDFSADVSLQEIIGPDSYVYGLAIFDVRSLAPGQKSVFRMTEKEGQRSVEVINFNWLKQVKP